MLMDLERIFIIGGNIVLFIIVIMIKDEFSLVCLFKFWMFNLKIVGNIMDIKKLIVRMV